MATASYDKLVCVSVFTHEHPPLFYSESSACRSINVVQVHDAMRSARATAGSTRRARHADVVERFVTEVYFTDCTDPPRPSAHAIWFYACVGFARSLTASVAGHVCRVLMGCTPVTLAGSHWRGLWQLVGTQPPMVGQACSLKGASLASCNINGNECAKMTRLS